MNDDVTQTARGLERLVEGTLSILAPFDPLIALVTTAVIAHFNATKTWPTEAQVRAALPADYVALRASVEAWTPSGDGTLPEAPARPTPSPASNG